MSQIKAFVLLLALSMFLCLSAKEEVKIAPSYAWTVNQPLGIRMPSTIDTMFMDYSMRSVPSAISPAWATTGNLGDPGINLIFSERKLPTTFFFADGLWPWLPSLSKIKYYNTRRPMTLLSYNFGGASNTIQDRLQGIFSGNVNKELQFGAIIDYLYSKGSYNNQAVKNFTWGFNGSYIGEKVEVMFYQYHYNLTNRESGGIEDDLYITNPGEIQGGNTTVDNKSIPTNLTQAQSRNKGSDIFLNAKYKVGFWRETELEDSTTIEEFVPVTAFIWNMNWAESKHLFTNANAQQDREFWPVQYLSTSRTDDITKYSSFKNTLGVSLLEGFNKYAKFGLSAYASIDLLKYHQTPDSMLYLPLDERPAGLTEYTGQLPVSNKSEAQISIGAQISKQKGSILKYEAAAELGITGRTAGDVRVDGSITTRIPMLRDSLAISAKGHFYNLEPSYFLDNYISNHYIWKNDFGKTRRYMVGGEIAFPRSMTAIKGEIENIQNYIYFDSNCMPVQHSNNVQVITLSISQNFKWKALHLDNLIILQKSTDHNVIPLPKFTIYSNFYLKFKIAKVLDVQFGADIDYYTRHKALAYQPATMTFYNDPQQEVGGFPFMNLYANMKLGKVRFYLMYSHFNKGIFGKPNYFSVPHYPLNPGRFQLGLSVEFTD